MTEFSERSARRGDPAGAGAPDRRWVGEVPPPDTLAGGLSAAGPLGVGPSGAGPVPAARWEQALPDDGRYGYDAAAGGFGGGPARPGPHGVPPHDWDGDPAAGGAVHGPGDQDRLHRRPRGARGPMPPVGEDEFGDGARSGPRHGAGPRPRARPEPRTRGQAALGAALEVVVVLSMALLLSLLIKTFLVQAFFIPSESMEDTLLKGDRVLVNKLTPGPFDLQRGDVVVFKDPGGWLSPTEQPQDGPVRSAVRSTLTFVGLLPQDSGEHLIKRVIGLPGDRVVCCDAQGRVSVNGVAIQEPYLFPGDQPSTKTFEVTVPEGRLWVMGDHRSVSEDSRYHETLPGRGFVPVEAVVGEAFVVVWPFERAGRLSVPPEVFDVVPDRPPAQ